MRDKRAKKCLENILTVKRKLSESRANYCITKCQMI